MITAEQIRQAAAHPVGVVQAWRVECKYSGRGYSVVGTFVEAVARALTHCTRPGWDRYIVWDREDDRNVRAADVVPAGIAYLFERYRHLATDFVPQEQEKSNA